jgi:hypothetical protein
LEVDTLASQSLGIKAAEVDAVEANPTGGGVDKPDQKATKR